MVHSAFTACVEERRRVLNKNEVADSVAEALLHAARKANCFIPIYCLMPDHLHVMFSGTCEESDTRQAMILFKAIHGKWLSERRLPWKWQRGFYDHRLRGDQDWRNHARYIALNPVRAGLAREMGEYPFAGTIGVEWNEVSAGPRAYRHSKPAPTKSVLFLLPW